jgi:hypothetical protein
MYNYLFIVPSLTIYRLKHLKEVRCDKFFPEIFVTENVV